MKDPSKTIHRILLVRLSSLGDCLMAIPVFYAIREQFPQAHLAWVIQDHFAALIQNLPGLDELIIFPKKRWQSLSKKQLLREAVQFHRRLRMRHFEVTVDVQSNTKSGIIAWLTRAPLRIGHGGEEAKELSIRLNNCLIPPPPNCPHIVLRNLNLLRPLGIISPEPKFNLPIDLTAKRTITRWLSANNLREKKFVLLIPFCGRSEKEWPRENFTELAKILAEKKIPAVFHCGLNREAETASMMPRSEGIYLSPPTSLLEMVELIRGAEIAVGGDTGPIQIAGALGVQTVALFGPTDQVRLRPWGNTQILSLASTPIEVMETLPIEIFSQHNDMNGP